MEWGGADCGQWNGPGETRWLVKRQPRARLTVLRAVSGKMQWQPVEFGRLAQSISMSFSETPASSASRNHAGRLPRPDHWRVLFSG